MLLPYERTVHYYETDQMGIVHHSNYIRWFEEARTDFLEKIGAGYHEMEKNGIISPVLSVSCRYHSMVRFGERVRIQLSLKSYDGIRLFVAYEVRDAESDMLRCDGESSHCFLGKDLKPISLKRSYPAYHEILKKALEEFGAGEEKKGKER